jgi:hypothetical protein
MLRLLPFLLWMALTVVALIDCLSAESSGIRFLPRALWIMIIVLAPLLGPVAWFLTGRPIPGVTPDRVARASREAARRPLAPDDDPEFLRRLSRQRRDDEELLRRWEADLRRREEEMRDRDPRGEDKPDQA